MIHFQGKIAAVDYESIQVVVSGLLAKSVRTSYIFDIDIDIDIEIDIDIDTNAFTLLLFWK